MAVPYDFNDFKVNRNLPVLAYIYNSINKRKIAAFSINPKKKKRKGTGEVITESFKYLADKLSIEPPIKKLEDLYLQLIKAITIFNKDWESKVGEIISKLAFRKQEELETKAYYFIIINKERKASYFRILIKKYRYESEEEEEEEEEGEEEEEEESNLPNL